MFKKILLGLVALLVIFVIVVALQPSHFRVERSVTLAAVPAEVFPHVNSLKKTHVWSPWTKLDPAAKYSFEGPESGVGAINTWAGNNQVGEGRQTIIESRPNELVRIKLDFLKPFESTSTAEFILRPENNKTVVTWALFGESNFISKAFCLFMNQDKMLGEPFERGLADLKAIVEQKKT